ncbi:MAG TPA: S8 family serine peptidase [Actinophytocola sp.]|uniref:S8 family peptidase n=1 Tax=Actinophytocola sp. TaxID=1872138 RepID=UPI002DBF8E19|nr:S8 family serine peptidase [Actinophytocola sp.]HEU5473910.1 S8 family serine peptidase [Actinophytocola sp.]
MEVLLVQRRLRIRGLAAAVVMASAAALTTVAATPAAAQEAPAAHFAVLGPQGAGLARTEASIVAAGGTILKSWPQIGVVIATSPSIVFAQALRRMPGVQGVGATRALVEFVPPVPAANRAATDLEAIESTNPTAGVGPAAFEPLEANQWDMRLIRADAASVVSGGSRNVLVGVLDSGIEATHPDLAPNLDAANSAGCVSGIPDPAPAAWAPTNSTHGTHVAGSIAAARNGVGIAGVAPNVRIASVKVVNDDGFIYPEAAICGFIWAAEHGMDVTNNSYFIDPWFKWCRDDPDQRAAAEAVRRAVDFAAGRDVVNVVALGNENWDLAHEVVDPGSPNNQTPIERTVGNDCPMLPQEISGAVGVSAVGAAARKSFYSNYGLGDTEIAAPGGDSLVIPETPDRNGRVLSTITGGRWGYAQGTSMASPHAAGVVALIRSTHQNWNANRVIRALEAQADRLACPPNPYDPTGDGSFLATCQGGGSGRGFYGAGLVDALDAVTK